MQNESALTCAIRRCLLALLAVAIGLLCLTGPATADYYLHKITPGQPVYLNPPQCAVPI